MIVSAVWFGWVWAVAVLLCEVEPNACFRPVRCQTGWAIGFECFDAVLYQFDNFVFRRLEKFIERLVPEKRFGL